MKGRNFASQVLSRHTFRISRKKGSDFFDHRGTLNANLREQYHDTLTEYKKLLNKKKNDYYNSKITELEENAEASDKKRFWECLKSMDDTRGVKDDIPPISEDNWLTYFRSLHSKIPLNSIQQSIINELKLLEHH